MPKERFKKRQARIKGGVEQSEYLPRIVKKRGKGDSSIP